MSKQTKQNKSDRKSVSTLEVGAESFDKQKRLDSTFYEQKYPDMQFMWINDMDGEVQRWLRLGAEPQVHENDQFDRKFPGLTDKNDGGYVTAVAGTDNGNPFNAYLLKMDRDLYQKVKIDPKEKRNREVHEAMGLAAKEGVADKDSRAGSDLDTYAPNLPTGGKGFEEIAGATGFNKLTS